MTLSRRDMLSSGTVTLALASVPAAAQGSSDAAARRLLDALAEERLRDSPGGATQRGLDTGPRAALRSRWPDTTAAGQRAIAGRLRRRVAEIDALDLSRLDPQLRLHLNVVRTSFATALDGFRLPYGDVAVGGYRNSPYVVIQNVGGFIDVPRVLEAGHSLATPADGEAYLARLAGYADLLDGETERVRAGTELGVVPPAFLLDKALAQLRTARGSLGAGSPIVSRLAKAMPHHAERAARIAADRIAPAFDRQIAALTEQRARAGHVAGVWRLPEGDAYYAWALRAATTTTRRPDEIHEQGLDELKGLHARMDTLLRRLGYSQGSVAARMEALGRDPKHLFPDSNEGREQILRYCRERIEIARAAMPRALTKLVKGNVEVRRIPIAEEPGAAGAYGGPGSKDGTITGKFWINLGKPGTIRRFELPTLAHHEAIPGHVWQGEYTFDLPLIRSLLSFSASGEGWGLYAEQLADELGLYADDPLSQLGYLDSIAFRACRLVVDTGLHAKRWTREQAKRFFADNLGDANESEVDRYCSWPGQACAYKVGHSELNRLRDATRLRLGARYDVRTFNDTVIQAGSLPLTVLASVVGGII